MEAYYARRAREYEGIYEKPERQADLARMRVDIPRLFVNQRVLEIACGTGYWTPLIAEQAESVLATDYNAEPLAIAKSKHYRKGNVSFAQADAYALPDWKDKFSACYAGFWWSHVPLGRIDGFLSSLGKALQPGAVVGHALRLIQGLGSTAGSLGMLVLLMSFMMIEAARYPAKLRAAAATTEAPDPDDVLFTAELKAPRRGTGAIARLDRFGSALRDYVVINTVFGLVAGALNTVLLLALGVDFAILWGVASFALSYLPNIGFLLALVPPALLALIQFGPGRALAVVGAFIAINFVVDTVVKPRFVGESLDLSPAVVLLSLVFWGWMLGVTGALLAVPLTMSVKFLLEGNAGTRWAAVLMSDADPGRAEREGPPVPPVAPDGPASA